MVLAVTICGALSLVGCSSDSDSEPVDSNNNSGPGIPTGIATSTGQDLDNDGINETFAIDLDGDGIIDGFNNTGNTSCQVEEGSSFCRPALTILENPGNLVCPNNPSYLDDFNFETVFFNTPSADLPRWQPSTDGTVDIKFFIDAPRSGGFENDQSFEFLQLFAFAGFAAWTEFPDGSPTWVGNMFKFEPVNNIDDANVVWSFCLLYTSPSPRDLSTSRMPSSA